MNKSALTALIILCVTVAAFAFFMHDNQPKVNSKYLTVVTYNINWGGRNSDQVIDYLLNSEANILCLQETTANWQHLLTQRLQHKYPYVHFHESAGAGGIAIMSMTEIIESEIIAAKAGWFPAQYAVVNSDIGQVQILNVHLKPPLSESGTVTANAYLTNAQTHQDELAHFMGQVDRHSALIIAGDFNENDNGKALQDVLNQGFTDALSLFDSTSITWSWKTDYFITLSGRYDHLLFNKYLRCHHAEVTSVDASDHFPVKAIFSMNEF